MIDKQINLFIFTSILSINMEGKTSLPFQIAYLFPHFLSGFHSDNRLCYVNKHSTGEVSLHISISILETSQWNDLHAIRTGIGHLAACDYNHQIWLTKRYLFFHLVVFTDKAFNLYKMGCSILYLTAA